MKIVQTNLVSADYPGLAYQDDLSHMDDWPGNSMAPFQIIEARKRWALSAVQTKNWHMKRRNNIRERENGQILSTHEENLRLMLLNCITVRDVEIIDTRILSLDERYPHPNPMWKRLERELHDAYDRAEKGKIIVHAGIKFPCKLVKGRNEASAIDKRGYKYWASQGYAPVSH